jgi:hypothetical protein
VRQVKQFAWLGGAAARRYNFQKHLQMHGNDREKSLAAVSSVGSVRDKLKQLGDADVEASLWP